MNIERLIPGHHRDAAYFLPRTCNVYRLLKIAETCKVVDDKPHRCPMLEPQLSRKAPHNANIAEIIDYATENVAGNTGSNQVGAGVDVESESTAPRTVR